MIIANTNTLGAQSGQSAALNLADLIAGRFGLFHAEDAPICDNLDNAIIGYMTITPDTKGNPQSGDFAYGQVQTLDSLGAGDDGQKIIPPVGGAKEWITQIILMADGSLYSRARVNNMAFQPFIKRW
ncbi:hypothetical protein ACOIPX_003439 [Salmonella enterica]|nr:hypothetical protein [Salmonella enterica]EBE9035307.1 hypothetical protein [Salmonella enterica]EBE9067660.1 hypothetical protein [Salmonella enterica]EHL2773997.1 hypothetical protein [Salmonella enterica subsp. enterica serovar Hvittingfoss]EHL2852318.1 hypothetical protein [Salmonella enterica subsp. enterica serovar Hvittingfoss]